MTLSSCSNTATVGPGCNTSTEGACCQLPDYLTVLTKRSNIQSVTPSSRSPWHCMAILLYDEFRRTSAPTPDGELICMLKGK